MMLFPKPEPKVKVPKKIPRKKERVPSAIDYSSMAYAKPVVTKKQPKTIKSRRKPSSKVTINGEFCFFCGSPYELEKHHIFYGTEWDASEKYGLKVKLCANCHRGSNGIHGGNVEMDKELKQMGKEWFFLHYPELDFYEIFGKNYPAEV